MCIVTGAVIVYMSYPQLTVSTDTSLPVVASIKADEDPSEAKIDPNLDYQVADNHPRQIAIPSINSNGFIQQVDVSSENEIGTPDNVHAAGWFTQRAIPGEKGLSIIDGHIRGHQTGGIFEHLKELDHGDFVHIEMGNHNIRKFKVIATRTVNREQANEALYEQSTERQLNLITCSGSYDDNAQSYQERHIVYTEFVE